MPALQLPQLCVLDCRCCGAFPSDVMSLPRLQTLGSSAPVAAAWDVVVDHMPAPVVAAAAAASSETAAVTSAAESTGTLATSAAVSSEQTPSYSEAVLLLLTNDIATPTRGRAWRVYCKK